MAIYEKGKTTYIGNPPGPVATELEVVQRRRVVGSG
jgi:hypothetical protein